MTTVDACEVCGDLSFDAARLRENIMLGMQHADWLQAYLDSFPFVATPETVRDQALRQRMLDYVRKVLPVVSGVDHELWEWKDALGLAGGHFEDEDGGEAEDRRLEAEWQHVQALLAMYERMVHLRRAVTGEGREWRRRLEQGHHVEYVPASDEVEEAYAQGRERIWERAKQRVHRREAARHAA